MEVKYVKRFLIELIRMLIDAFELTAVPSLSLTLVDVSPRRLCWFRKIWPQLFRKICPVGQDDELGQTCCRSWQRGVGRPSKVAPFEQRIKEILDQEPALLGVEILRWLRLDGYTGGKSVLPAREFFRTPIKGLTLGTLHCDELSIAAQDVPAFVLVRHVAHLVHQATLALVDVLAYSEDQRAGDGVDGGVEQDEAYTEPNVFHGGLLLGLRRRVTVRATGPARDRMIVVAVRLCKDGPCRGCADYTAQGSRRYGSALVV